MSDCTHAYKNDTLKHDYVRYPSGLKPESVRFPPESINIIYGTNRKRGRSGKNKPALERQGDRMLFDSNAFI